MSKDKRKKANFSKSCKNFKMVDGHLTYKGEKRAIFDNNRYDITLNTTLHNTTLFYVIQYSFTRFELQNRYAVKCFSMMRYLFLFTRKFRE